MKSIFFYLGDQTMKRGIKCWAGLRPRQISQLPASPPRAFSTCAGSHLTARLWPPGRCAVSLESRRRRPRSLSCSVSLGFVPWPQTAPWSSQPCPVRDFGPGQPRVGSGGYIWCQSLLQARALRGTDSWCCCHVHPRNCLSFSSGPSSCLSGMGWV